VIVSVLRSVTRRRLVVTENPNACATVNCNLCNSAIALYCLYLSVIQRESVSEVLINPIIRDRPRQFVTRTSLHVTIYIYIYIYIDTLKTFILFCCRMLLKLTRDVKNVKLSLFLINGSEWSATPPGLFTLVEIDPGTH
jgi:hypothetical protein